MLDWVASVVSTLGYVGIAALMFLENLFPPIPSELIMPLSGFAVARGDLELSYVLIAGTVGTILGALPWYYLGRTLGIKRLTSAVERHGKWFPISVQDIEDASAWLNKRRSSVAVLVGRLVPGIRTYISVPAGLVKMPMLPFLTLSTIGTLIWNGLLTYAGFLLGSNYDRVGDYVDPISKAVFLGIGVAILLLFIRQWRRMRE